MSNTYRIYILNISPTKYNACNKCAWAMYQTKVLLVNEKWELDRCQWIDLQSVKVLESLVVYATYTFVFCFVLFLYVLGFYLF